MKDSSEELRQSIVELLWKQWSSLGVSGHSLASGNALIDPEALLLFSTTFARYDVRLFDEMADWLEQNGHWINLLRLARIQKEFEVGDVSVLGALAETLIRSASHAKWKALAKKVPPSATPILLFPHLPNPNRIDPIFGKWGWRRTPLETRGLSKTPRSSDPGALIIKLRSLFGVQSRAEIVAWLLAHDSGHPAQIARETGYFRGSVQSVLNELEVSGLVNATRLGREKRFSAPRERWRSLITWSPNPEEEFPKWVPWAVLFTLLRRYHDLIASPAFAGYSTDLQSIEVNRILTPLLTRLSSEGHPSQDLAIPSTGYSEKDITAKFQRLLLAATE